MSRLELKVPPVAVTLVAAALMWVVAALTPQLPIALVWRALVAAVLVAAALAVGIPAIRGFAAQHTTVNPTTPDRSSHLVTAGVYRYTRNPMYLAMLLMLLAVAALLGNVFSLVAVPLYVLYMDRFQISVEERALREHFGEDYERYCQRVRRWV